jgi:hypothetical protein
LSILDLGKLMPISTGYFYLVADEKSSLETIDAAETRKVYHRKKSARKYNDIIPSMRLFH